MKHLNNCAIQSAQDPATGIPWQRKAVCACNLDQALVCSANLLDSGGGGEVQTQTQGNHRPNHKWLTDLGQIAAFGFLSEIKAA